MIIICPNCGTRYEVGDQTIGATGRKVKCATCEETWQAKAEREPEDDMLFRPEQEQVLDKAFEEEEMAAARAAGDDEVEPIDPALQSWRKKAMLDRHRLLSGRMPRARVRRAARMVSAIMLMTLVGGGIVLREPIVRGLPDLAGFYDAIGLGVNVVGLEFTGVSSLRAMSDGSSALILSGRIDNVAGRQVDVPQVLVTLINDEGGTLFEWTMTPQARILAPGETVEFDTRLTSPPENAARARLTFVTGGRVEQNA